MATTARIQNYGLANVTATLVAATANPIKWVGWGTGTTAAATATNLTTPAANSSGTRINGTRSQQTTTVTNDTFQVTATLTAGGALAITEVGVFDDQTTAATLCVYGNFDAINLANNDSIAFTVKVQFS